MCPGPSRPELGVVEYFLTVEGLLCPLLERGVEFLALLRLLIDVLELVLNVALLLKLLELEVVLLLEIDEELVLLTGRTQPEIGCETTLKPDAVPGLTRTISTQRSGRVTVILWESIVKV